ncbi:DoxX family protein [Marinilongibacter aquaticus]|uniref:DoxX family protein n=1 Tax=Marinilongibacter aquaticus TaxID=2975157 RepID=UPI0021BD3465|nr:DoxX family protein [Marinilongibacter aquaticus]UBM59691.1 DoxX family protein [Marinilongibacter aquaticus]
MSPFKKYLGRLLRIAVAIIFLQTLYFKFSAHPDSVYIFSKLGVEPYGRIGLGILELITGILILIPKTAKYGMFSGLVLISGALASHLGPLGIEIRGDGGTLFYLAVLTFALTLVWWGLNFQEIKSWIKPKA